MFKLVQVLGRVLVRLYRSESARLHKLADAQSKEATGSTQAAQALLRAADDLVDASRNNTHLAVVREDHAAQLESFFK